MSPTWTATLAPTTTTTTTSATCDCSGATGSGDGSFPLIPHDDDTDAFMSPSQCASSPTRLSGPPDEGTDAWRTKPSPHFTRLLTLCVVLILFGGVMSGMQQAVMQVNFAQLTAMRRDGSESERKMAALLEPLVRRRHLTLVALLIGNALAMEALPAIMDLLMPKVLAIVFSVSAVVLFSEIIPQALCLRWPLELAALFAWAVYLLVAMLYPIAAPIAWLLDQLFGHDHEQLLTKAGLKELVTSHAKAHGSAAAVLSEDELGIITGALELHKQTAGDAMTPLDKAFMLSTDAVLDDNVMASVVRSGHSRVPVSAEGASDVIVGLLLVKHLVRLDKDVQVKNLDTIYPVLVVRESVSLFALLKRFSQGHSHMAVVVRESAGESLTATTAASTSAGSATTMTMTTAGGDGGAVKSLSGQAAAARASAAAFADDGVRVCDPFRPETYAAGALGILTLEDVLEKPLRIDIQDEKDTWKPAVDDIESRLSRVDALARSLHRRVSPSLSLGSETGPILKRASRASYGALGGGAP